MLYCIAIRLGSITIHSTQSPNHYPILSFKAYVHGLKPEVKEDALKDFFAELEVVSLSIHNCEGKVEFKDRDNLARGLFYCGRLLSGREVKVDLSSTPAPKAIAATPAPAPAATQRQRADDGNRRHDTRNAGGRQHYSNDRPRGGGVFNNTRSTGGGGYRQRGDRENQNSGPSRDFNRPAPWARPAGGGEEASNKDEQPPKAEASATEGKVMAKNAKGKAGWVDACSC